MPQLVSENEDLNDDDASEDVDDDANMGEVKDRGEMFKLLRDIILRPDCHIIKLRYVIIS